MSRAAVHKLVLRACTSGAVVGAAVLWLAMSSGPIAAQTPPPAPPQATPAASTALPASAPAAPAIAASRPQVAASPAVSASRPVRSASSAKSNGRHAIKPLWRDLRPAEQQALAPLASTWDTISYVQKRKWLTVSQGFPKLAPPEQEKLHSRMTEWVALSPQQRAQARLNFGATQQLSPDDKKAKWEAYQALPAEEKRKLAAAAPKPPATAAAVKPLPAGKLATVPRAKAVAKSPRIAEPAGPVDHNTLLPRTAPASAPARAS